MTLIDELIVMARGDGYPDRMQWLGKRYLHHPAPGALAGFCTRLLRAAMGDARANAALLWFVYRHELRAAGKEPWFIDPSKYIGTRRGYRPERVAA